MEVWWMSDWVVLEHRHNFGWAVTPTGCEKLSPSFPVVSPSKGSQAFDWKSCTPNKNILCTVKVNHTSPSFLGIDWIKVVKARSPGHFSFSDFIEVGRMNRMVTQECLLLLCSSHQLVVHMIVYLQDNFWNQEPFVLPQEKKFVEDFTHNLNWTESLIHRSGPSIKTPLLSNVVTAISHVTTVIFRWPEPRSAFWYIRIEAVREGGDFKL